MENKISSNSWLKQNKDLDGILKKFKVKLSVGVRRNHNGNKHILKSETLIANLLLTRQTGLYPCLNEVSLKILTTIPLNWFFFILVNLQFCISLNKTYNLEIFSSIKVLE